MIERLDDLPDGVIGLRSSGKLSVEDYREVLEPALQEGVDAGELRLLFVLADFEGLEPGAWVEDMKTGLGAWFRDHAAWRRFALVTDVEWVTKAMAVFAWMAPGEARTFGLAELDEATRWAAEG